MIIKTPGTEDIPALRELWKEAFGDGDEFLDIFFAVAYDKDRAFVLEKDGNAAGALYWFNCECNGSPVAYIYGVATAVKYRGQGVCHRLMEYTHNHLKERGYAGVVLVPGSGGLFDLYKGMGYEICSSVRIIRSEAWDMPSVVTVIGKAEYTALRRKFLPPGGVVQENENIDFLSAFADFYKGGNFIFAGRQSNGTFRGVEFLGDTAEIQGVLKTLGCSDGEFRTYGEDKPFAMYYPLKDSAEMPRYFGLAFD